MVGGSNDAQGERDEEDLSLIMLPMKAHSAQRERRRELDGCVEGYIDPDKERVEQTEPTSGDLEFLT